MKLSRFIVVPPVTEARIAREWEAIERRAQPVRHRVAIMWAMISLPVALASFWIIFFTLRRPSPSVLDGAVFGSDSGRVDVDLADGSHIEVEPMGRLAISAGSPQSVHVELRRGAASFEVTHVERQGFVVSVGAFDIGVIGTRFGVTVSGRPGPGAGRGRTRGGRDTQAWPRRRCPAPARG